jgi:hypothetical protein
VEINLSLFLFPFSFSLIYNSSIIKGLRFMAIEKYLYLQKLSFAENWINGGEIPAPCLASSYLDSERSGTKTVDETHIIEGDDPRI